jgi:hypothetical protein
MDFHTDKRINMTLKSNPHVKSVSVTLEMDQHRNVEEVTHVVTDLILDGLHPKYNKSAVDSVITDVETHIQSQLNFSGRVSITGP